MVFCICAVHIFVVTQSAAFATQHRAYCFVANLGRRGIVVCDLQRERISRSRFHEESRVLDTDTLLIIEHAGSSISVSVPPISQLNDSKGVLDVQLKADPIQRGGGRPFVQSC